MLHESILFEFIQNTRYLYRLAIAFFAICRATSRAIFSLENQCGKKELGCDRS